MATETVKRRARGDMEAMRKQALYISAKTFLNKGYTATTLREIAKEADINIGSLMNLFGSKEEILAELVKYVLEGQFKATANLLKEKAKDKILFYAAETTLQLHMAESSEHIRDIYNSAYSLPKTTAMIQHTITGKLEEIFKPTLPHLETKDFFELEIASGGIMRGFMTIPCDMYFTMDRKVKRFLETTFKLYDVPMEKIQETIEFVSGFDFEAIAKQTIEAMLAFLDEKVA
ncbi:MAG: TetR/AcrR family transcriptional regulator [Clostridia bacterium]|nr:TetR/AcrR family transcriptional regulator [Clostridia bacterium]MBQ8893233.1 TetR/AcrR family transcriptional regulator [Clostridia bacterium]